MKKTYTPTPKQRIEKLKIQIELLEIWHWKKADIKEKIRELKFWKNYIKRHF